MRLKDKIAVVTASEGLVLLLWKHLLMGRGQSIFSCPQRRTC